MRRAVMTLTNIPLVNPEIVTGVSLSLLFVFIGRNMLGTENILGFGTLLIAHVTFNLPYVILSVMPKLRQTDPSLMDAAQDLGCTPVQGFFKVMLPELWPGIIAGAIMAFTMSLDDFVISYFTYSPNFSTLPVEIYAISPQARAADVLRDVHAAVLRDPRRDDWHEHRAGARRAAAGAQKAQQSLKINRKSIKGD